MRRSAPFTWGCNRHISQEQVPFLFEALSIFIRGNSTQIRYASGISHTDEYTTPTLAKWGLRLTENMQAADVLLAPASPNFP